MAGTRTSPIDSGNLARSFPAIRPAGRPRQIAEGIHGCLLPQADFLVDLHSGGITLDYLPCAFGRLPADAALARTLARSHAGFRRALYAVVMRQPEARGTLVSAALEHGSRGDGDGTGRRRRGDTGHDVRLPSGDCWPPRSSGDAVERQGQSASRTRLMAIEPDSSCALPAGCLFEPAFSLGDAVQAGDLAGLLWDLERQDQSPEELRFGPAGMVLCRRVPAMAEAGDVLRPSGKGRRRSDFF